MTPYSCLEAIRLQAGANQLLQRNYVVCCGDSTAKSLNRQSNIPKIGYNALLHSESSNTDFRSELTGAEFNQQHENRYE